MQNDDKALPSISLAGHGQLVKKPGRSWSVSEKVHKS